MSTYDGQFIWYELMTSDSKAAQDFYSKTVGWDPVDSGMPGMDYTLFKIGETSIAGVMTLPDEVAAAGGRPGWLGYVAVEDVDAKAKDFEAAGGVIHHAPDAIPGIGRFAVVGDPQGAVICLFRGEGEPPTPLPKDSIGTIGWHELYAEDLDPALAFYCEQFGWDKMDAVDMGPMGLYQMFGRNGTAIGGMMKRPDQMPAPAWSYYVIVESAEAAIARATSAGGQIVNGPMEVPGGMWIAQGLDPQGAFFAVVAASK